MIPALLALLSGAPALADEPVETTVNADLSGAPRGFGLGIVVGEPTGLTMAVRPDEMNALQVHASWSVIADRFRVSADYLRTFAVARADGFDVPVYVGIGGVAGVQGGSGAVGGRIPIGLAVHPERTPLEPFVEVAPGVLVLPETTPIFEGALGLRYYF